MKLRDARLARFLSHGALAAKSGVSAATIKKIEYGLQRPWLDTCRKLADALGVDPGYIDEFRESQAQKMAKPQVTQ